MGGPVAGVDGNWRCPACQNVNFAVREACNRCGAPRPAEEAWRAGPKGSPPAAKGGKSGKGGKGGKPVVGVNGNWQCASCGNVNFGVREACNRCGAPRPESEGEASDVLMAGVGGAWECARCATVNYADRGECNMCGSPRPEDARAQLQADVAALQAGTSAELERVAEEDRWAARGAEEEQLLLEGGGQEQWHARGTKRPAGAGGKPVAGVDGNWACTSCGNVNFAVRQVCNRCQAPRALSEHAPVRVAPLRIMPPGAAPLGSSPRSGAGRGPVGGVDGNWSCEHCQNVNFAHRDACNRCGAPRPQSGAEWPPQRAPKGGGKGGPPVAGVDGNWQCPYCSNVNFAVRAQCNRCGAPREEGQAPPPPPPQPRAPIYVGGGGKGGALYAPPQQKGGSKGPPVSGVDGNWKCQFCGNVNFAVREACNRCGALKDDAEAPVPAKGKGGKGGKGPPVPGENGNWGCPSCGNVNYASREVCNRCGAPKPEEDAADAGPEPKRAKYQEETAWLAAGDAFEAELVAAEEAASTTPDGLS